MSWRCSTCTLLLKEFSTASFHITTFTPDTVTSRQSGVRSDAVGSHPSARMLGLSGRRSFGGMVGARTRVSNSQSSMSLFSIPSRPSERLVKIQFGGRGGNRLNGSGSSCDELSGWLLGVELGAHEIADAEVAREDAPAVLGMAAGTPVG